MPTPPAQPDTSIIAGAPIEPGDLVGAQAPDEQIYQNIIGDLALKLEELTAENDKLKGQRSVETARADLLAPFSNKVFWFVAGYCVVVALILALCGWKSHTRFELSDTILGIIAGSTAISVIGLIGAVVTGLFGLPAGGARK
ncbi:hypothetical protein [Allosphingosinicella vermicomposti]|uniref:hypothetical protein n=1 Tax=Allosphingosinicella vermicomposti TaxID=614671 RepID=UPI000D0E3578|nr:hypothetical protein [Allosphingosinicella vermicomposti]